MNRIKRCAVCGDEATGFNYTGLSCESCKVFFHRNSSRIDSFKCKKLNNCTINRFTRRCCTSCRMKKCLQIGMRKKVSDSINDKNECNFEINKNLTNLNDSNVLMKNKIRPLNSIELQLINEARKAMSAFDDEMKGNCLGHAHDPKQGIDIPLIYIKKSIQYCQNFYQYNQLDNSEKLLIIKTSAYYVQGIRNCFNYDLEQNGCYFFINETDTLFYSQTLVKKYFKIKTERHNHIMDYSQKLVIDMKHVMENDSTILNLLAAQLFFNIKQPLSCFELFRYDYFRYVHVMQRYLENKYQCQMKANEKCVQLLNFAEKIKQIRYDCRIILLENERIEFIPEIVYEIYNIT